MIPKAPIPYLYDRLFGPLSNYQYHQRFIELSLSPDAGGGAWPHEGRRLLGDRAPQPVEPLVQMGPVANDEAATESTRLLARGEGEAARIVDVLV